MPCTSSRFFTGLPPAVRQPLRFQPSSHSDAHLMAYWESDSMRSGSALWWARTASSRAMSSAIWFVPEAAPPESKVPSWLIHAQPIAPPGLTRHEPSVLTVITCASSLIGVGSPSRPLSPTFGGARTAVCSLCARRRSAPVRAWCAPSSGTGNGVTDASGERRPPGTTSPGAPGQHDAPAPTGDRGSEGDV
ncbi:hypothetical protein D3C74_381440 [compost metagenome]